MAVVEAVLIYRPGGLGQDGGIPLGATADCDVLHAVGDQLLDEARGAVDLWRDVDPGLAGMKQAEADRLQRVLELILPDEAIGPDLELVK